MTNKERGRIYRLFLITFIVLLVAFGTLSVTTMNSLRSRTYELLEQASLDRASTHSDILSHYTANSDYIRKTLNQRVLIAARAVARSQAQDGRALEKLAEDFLLDEIYIYNKEGEILASNGRYLGWHAPLEHPSKIFIESKKFF